MALVACYEAEESGPAVQPSLLIVEMAQHTEAGRPTDLEKQWAPLRRESPDPTAPSTPPFPVRLGISLFTYPALLLTLLVVLPYTVIKHITVGPPADWMPLSTHLEGRLVYWSGKLVDSAYLPPQDKEEAAVPSNLPLEWAKEGRRGVDVEKVIVPKLETKYRMGLGEIRGVESEDRPGFILTPRELKAVGSGTELAEEGEKVIMYLFGGGYASGHPVKFPFPWQMSKVLCTRLFGVNYRKTLSSETAFPAPILDALAGYLYLTQKLRFPSSSIILLGDSSGAHLGLCLSQHLHDLRIAQPGYILLTSPLGDVRRAMPSRAEFAGVDILAETMDAKPLHSAMRHYTDGAKDQPAFSPARSRKGDWTFLREEQVKVYIMVGTKEILRDDGLAIVEAMKRDGVDVTLREDVGGSHCGPLAQWKGSSAWQVWQDDTKRIVQGRRYIVEDADEA